MTAPSCPYYNQGLFLGSLPNGNTQISMCCFQNKKIVDEVRFDDPYLTSIRKDSVKGIPSQCDPTCSVPGHIANEREKSLSEWKDLFKETNTKAIKMLHLEQSLVCNLMCISCSTKYSSAWNKHYHHFDTTAPKIKLAKFPEEKWKNLDLTHLEKLHFTGGEPLLNADNKKILQHLEKLKILENVMISYNTNGTVLPDKETLRLWNKSRFVRLFFSLDGVGSVFDYTRFPASWKTVNNNIQKLREHKDACILIEVSAITGIHNIFNLPELFNWWENHCKTGSQGDDSNIFVKKISGWSFGGKVLDLKHLSDHHSKLALDTLHSLTQYPGVNDLIESINTRREPADDWIKYLDKLDHLRNTNWRNSLPKELN